MRLLILVSTTVTCLVLVACGGGGSPTVLATFSLDDLESVVDRDEEIKIDSTIFREGSGSLLIQAKKKRNVRLFEIQNPVVEESELTYSADLKCISLWGRAFLEIWCHFPDGRAVSRRAYQAGVGRTTDWTRSEVTFPLEAGEKPSRILLNVRLDGGGNVWVDNVQLTSSPLP
jgi:hypothetical protein